MISHRPVGYSTKHDDFVTTPQNSTSLHTQCNLAEWCETVRATSVHGSRMQLWSMWAVSRVAGARGGRFEVGPSHRRRAAILDIDSADLMVKQLTARGTRRPCRMSVQPSSTKLNQAQPSSTKLKLTPLACRHQERGRLTRSGPDWRSA